MNLKEIANLEQMQSTPPSVGYDADNPYSQQSQNAVHSTAGIPQQPKGFLPSLLLGLANAGADLGTSYLRGSENPTARQFGYGQQMSQEIAASNAAKAQQTMKFLHGAALAKQKNSQSRLTGLPQEYQSLALLGKMHGTDSKIYLNAKEELEDRRAARKQLGDYREGLLGTMDKRTSTALGKTQHEIQDIEAGYKPGTGRTEKIKSPEKQAALKDKYLLSEQKMISDSDTRKRALFASNIDKTISNIDVDKLVQYGGVLGQSQKISQNALASIGMQSKDFEDYKKALSASKLLAKQIRQFYGDSIVPAIAEKTEQLVNPASWSTNPELAKQNFDQLVGILHQETQTFRGALQGVGEYRTPSSHESPDNVNAQTSQGAESNARTITIRNKKTKEIITVPYEKAKKMGAVK